jgi:hypothetical protein
MAPQPRVSQRKHVRRSDGLCIKFYGHPMRIGIPLEIALRSPQLV